MVHHDSIQGLRRAYCYSGISCHLPIGHASVANLIFAHVEQPHFVHLPVLFKATESQNSHPLQIFLRISICSSVAFLAPEDTHFVTAVAADPIMASWGLNELKKAIQQATEKMNSASKNLEFMEAAQYRDEIKALEKRISEI